MDQLSQRGLYKAPLQSRSDAPLKLEHLFSEQKSFLPSESFRVVIDLEKQFHDLSVHPSFERDAVVHNQPMQEIVDFRTCDQIPWLVLRINGILHLGLQDS